jgi:lysophospholipase L1-like esterase
MNQVKNILCYGDSNTWGIDYTTGGRVPFPERWPNVLQQELGSSYHVIEEGMNGRTTVYDDPLDDCPEAKNGKKSLIPCLRSHFPLDMVILMLGTNDLKLQFFVDVDSIADHIGELVTMTREELQVRQGSVPPVMIVAPMPLGPTIESSSFCSAFGGKKALAPSIELASVLGKKAKDLSCSFIDAGKIAQPNTVDAVHFTKKGHHTFALAVAKEVRDLL